MTLRQIVHVSLGGAFTRVVLTNEFGTEPLTIGAVHVALSAGGSSIKLGSANAVAFGGSPTITIPPGALAVSDGFALTLPGGADVAVSLFVPAQTISKLSQHGAAYQTNYLVAGNVVSTATLENPKTFVTWHFLKGIDVRRRRRRRNRHLRRQHHRRRLQHAATKRPLARRPRPPPQRRQEDRRPRRPQRRHRRQPHPARQHRPQRARPLRPRRHRAGRRQVRHHPRKHQRHRPRLRSHKPYDVVTADDLIAGLHADGRRAHTHGIKVYGATLTPYVGAKYDHPRAKRSARPSTSGSAPPTTRRRHRLRQSHAGPRPPRHVPARLRPRRPPPPRDAGYKAMGDSIDLKLFSSTK